MQQDYRIRATAAEGQMRAVAVASTHTARTAQAVHQASLVAAAALGRTLSGVALLAADVKSGERLVLEIAGDGPLGRVVAEARHGSELRARAAHPEVELPLRADGKLAVGQAVGVHGYLRVLRELTPGGWYQGQVALVSGEIGDDLLHYYWQSEQTPSALAIGVLVGTDGRVAASGGLLVQALPDLSERERERVSENFRQLSQISWRLSAGETLEALLAEVLGPSLQLYAPEPIGWRCWCSRARMQEILLSLPAGDYQDLVEDGGAELTCHFCRQAYRFDRQDLLALRSNLGP